jgi:hypothetical protein
MDENGTDMTKSGCFPFVLALVSAAVPLVNSSAGIQPMTDSKLRFLAAAILVLGLHPHATNADSPAASTTTAPPATVSTVKTKPTKEEVKKAAEVGFQARTVKGVTMYCRSDAPIGSRITSTRCLTGDEFDDYLVQLTAARDNINKAGCTGGNTCQPEHR